MRRLVFASKRTSYARDLVPLLQPISQVLSCPQYMLARFIVKSGCSERAAFPVVLLVDAAVKRKRIGRGRSASNKAMGEWGSKRTPRTTAWEKYIPHYYDKGLGTRSDPGTTAAAKIFCRHRIYYKQQSFDVLPYNPFLIPHLFAS